MAIAIDFCTSLSSCAKLITFTDLTGDYNVTTNPSGWGAPNELRSAVTASTLTLTDPGGVVYTIDITTETVAGTDAEIDPTEIGYSSTSDQIADGYYLISWEVVVGSTYTELNGFFYTGVIDGLVCSLIANVDPSVCDCNCTDDPDMDKAILAWTYLLGLKSAACCGKTTKFDNILSTLERLTAENKCKSC